MTNPEKENLSLWWALVFAGIILLTIMAPGKNYVGSLVMLFLAYEYLTLMALYVVLIDWLCIFTLGILIGYLFVQYVEEESKKMEKYFYFSAFTIISLIILVTWVFTKTDAFTQLNWKESSLYFLVLSISIYGAYKVFAKKKRPASSDLNEEHSISNDSINSKISLFLLEGRVGRVTFWIITIPIFWASIGTVLFPIIFKDSWAHDIASWVYNTGANFIMVALLVWLQFTIFVKRLHDLGMPSWLALVLFTPLHYPCLILVGLFSGKTGPNKYGEKPQYQLC